MPQDGQQDMVDAVVVDTADSVVRMGMGDAVARGGLVIVMTAVVDMALLHTARDRVHFRG